MTTPPPAPRRRSFEFTIGLLIGVVMLGVGWLLAGRSEEPASPAPAAASTARAPASPGALGAAANPHAEVPSHGGAELDREHQERIERWRAAVEQGSDPQARQRLALVLLEAGQFYEAFAESEKILASSPEDLDGLYVQGAVRVRMGQSQRALPLLEKVLAERPDHVAALVAKGRALQKAGHPDLAVASWRRALEAAGGRNDEIERMIQTVELGQMLTPASP